MDIRVCLRKHGDVLRSVGVDVDALTSPEAVEQALNEAIAERQAILDQVGTQIRQQAEVVAETQQQQPDMGAPATEEAAGEPGDNLTPMAEPLEMDIVLPLKNNKSEAEGLAKATAALEALLGDVVEGFEVYEDDAGHTHVRMMLPPQEARAPDTSKSLVESVVRMFRDGVTDVGSKLEVEDTNNPSPKGGGTKLRISGKELSKVGKLLRIGESGPDSAVERKRNVLAALAWLEQRGVRLRTEDGMPKDSDVVGVLGARKTIKWEQIKDAETGGQNNRELFQKMREQFTVAGPDGMAREVKPYQYDEIAELLGTQAIPEQEAQADETFLRSVAEVIGRQIEETKEAKLSPAEKREQLRQLYRNKRAVERAANVLRDQDFQFLDEQTVQDTEEERRNQTFIGGSDVQGEGLESQASTGSAQDAYDDDVNRTRGGIKDEARPDDFVREYERATTPEAREEAIRSKRMALGSEPWLASTVDTLYQILKKIGLGNVVFRMATDSGLNDLEAMYTRPVPETMRKNSARKAWMEAVAANQAAIAALRAGDVAARILKLKLPNNPGRSIPVIFISSKVPPAGRPRKIMHEMGHLVLYHQLQALDKAPLRELYKELGAKSMADFHERFAETFAAWYFGGQDAAGPAMSGATRKFLVDSKLAAGKKSPLLKDLFNKVLTSLQSLYKEIRRKFGKDAPESFNKFMRTWLQAIDGRSPRYAQPIVDRFLATDSSGIEFADFTPVEEVVRNAANRAARSRRAQRLAKAMHNFRAEVLRPLHQTVTQSADAWMRDNNLVWLADMFHRRPGARNAHLGPTLGHEVMQQMARWQTRLNAVAEKYIPKRKLFGKTEEPQMLKDAREMLHGRMTPDKTNPVYREMRTLYDEMHAWLVKNGIPVAKVKDYFPVVYSPAKIMEGRDEFLTQVMEGAAEWNAKVEQQAEMSADLGQEAVDKILATRIDNPVEYADWLYRKITAEPSMHETGDGLEVIAPGFQHKKHRTLPEEVRKRLGGFMEDDIVETTMRYISSAVKRVAWQKRFGLNDVLAEIERAYETARNVPPAERAGAYEEADALKNRYRDEYRFRYNVDIYDPSAGLVVDALDRLRSGEITQEVYDRLITKVLPAYQGRLGADMYPTLKKMSALAVLYQNLRLLAFGIFSQIVDIGTAGARSGNAVAYAREIARLMRSADRKTLMDMASAIGSIRDDLTNHVLNDSADVISGFRWMRRANDKLFVYNGMHWANNAMRAVAVSMGRQVIQKSVERGPNDAEAVKQLEKISLNMDRAKAWVDAGMPMDAAHEQWADIYGALNQFVDESVVRPTPMTRPVWGSDQRFAPLWHLKSFMWAYHEAVFRRVVQETKDARGLQRAMPMLTLAAFTLPLAALGMELRWLLAPPKVRPEGGWDYFQETVQRAGLLGLYQVWADFDDAEDYGRLAILSAAGPSLGQLEEITTKDADYWAPRALPLRPVFQMLGNFAGD